MSLTAIKDQEVAVRLLQNILRRKRIPNGLLFWGPSGVGKRLAALELAKAVNCKTAPDDGCDECLSCRKIRNGNHPDVRVIVPADKSCEIKKQDVDEINELAALRPFESDWRVFVIEDAERMNIVAQNHFLKTLEEPPGQSLFILLSEYPRLMLPTIRSRCQAARFRTLRIETVVEWLQRERDLPPDVAFSIAALAGGQMSRALDLVETEKRDVVLSIVERLAQDEDPILLAEEFAKLLDDQRKQIEVSVEDPKNVEGMDAGSREDLAEQKERRVAQLQALVKRAILEYLYLLETWYRDELVFGSTGDADRVLNRDQVARLQRGVSSAPDAKIAAVEKARRCLDRFINEERVFRDLFFALAVP